MSESCFGSQRKDVEAKQITCPRCHHDVQPNVPVCEYCGALLGSAIEAAQHDTNIFDDNPLTFECPACKQPCNANSVSCPHCGKGFVELEDTGELDPENLTTSSRRKLVREISVDDAQPVLLQIEGDQQWICLPVAPVVVVGRLSKTQRRNGVYPHIDLSAFDAYTKGVSREHIKISRKYGLVYVTDIGSSNGTILNGIRLAPHDDRALRSGDTLRLGHLTISIIFPTTVPVQQTGMARSQ